MDQRLDRIESKLDKIVDKQSEMNATLAGQAVSLDDHIKRTEMLESELKPVKKHIDRLEGGLKLLGILLALFEAAKWLWRP